MTRRRLASKRSRGLKPLEGLDGGTERLLHRVQSGAHLIVRRHGLVFDPALEELRVPPGHGECAGQLAPGGSFGGRRMI